MGSSSMNASVAVTAAEFSAFVKCPTKAHLLAINEPSPGTYFADIEARMTAAFKEVAKRRLRIGVAIAEPLDFGQQCRRVDNQGILDHVDCEKAVFDLAPPPRPKDREFQQSTHSGTFVPVLFCPGDKPD